MLKDESQLRSRDLYLNRLIAFQDTEPVKIITGIRRCGKSSLMKLMARHLRHTGVLDEQIIEMNFESMEFRGMSAEMLYRYVKERILAGKRAYLFLDEIQRIDQWQDAVNSFRVDIDCDIYVSGSNAYLLSSEYATYLAGRSVEIKVLPLSFREFIDFYGYTVRETRSPAGGIRMRICDSGGESYEPVELLDAYIKFGGMPGISDVGLDMDKAMALLDGVYSTVVVRDILEREKRRGQRQITDSVLLRKIIMFLADNIGNNTSLTSIGNILINEKLLDSDNRMGNRSGERNGERSGEESGERSGEGNGVRSGERSGERYGERYGEGSGEGSGERSGKRRGKPAVQTIQAYVGALLESFVFYEIKRFDIKGKEYLRTLGKFYIVDIGLRNYLLGFRDMDAGHITENIVYFELLRRGYDVAIGKIGDREVDFIATNAYEKRYIQVTESMNDPVTREREFAPLRKIRDNYEKLIIAKNCDNPVTQDGIKIILLVDFLLD